MVGITNGARLFAGAELAPAVHGEVVRVSARPITGVCADSRAVATGDLFIPLPGARVDGHDFVVQAIERGAVAVFIEKTRWQKQATVISPLLEERDVTCLLTGQNLSALQDLARVYLRRFPKLVRIGITGSSGKTTTKEIVGAILSRDRRTAISEGNLNSEIGVPLAAFRVNESHQCAVFEMGIDHEGEMEILASIVRPDIAVVTNIGTAHVGRLGSREKIAEEKGKIAAGLPQTGALFLFEDEPYAERVGRSTTGRVVRYGPRSTQGLQGSRSLGLDGTTIDWEGLQIHFPLVGEHNLRNALAAISVAGFLGVPPATVKAGLEAALPLFGRSEIIRGDITVIKDCYNANPDSVQNALTFLNDLDWDGRKLAVLGSMKELGGRSAEYHRAIGQHVAGTALAAVYFFGEEMREALAAAKEKSFRGAVFLFSDFGELSRAVGPGMRSGDIILVKGSRAMELERLLPSLTGGSGKGEDR